MELHHHRAARVLCTDNGIGEPFCREGLAYAGCALQYHVLLRSKDVDERVIGGLVHVHLGEEALLVVGFGDEVIANAVVCSVVEGVVSLLDVVCALCLLFCINGA